MPCVRSEPLGSTPKLPSYGLLFESHYIDASPPQEWAMSRGLYSTVSGAQTDRSISDILDALRELPKITHCKNPKAALDPHIRKLTEERTETSGGWDATAAYGPILLSR